MLGWFWGEILLLLDDSMNDIIESSTEYQKYRFVVGIRFYDALLLSVGGARVSYVSISPFYYTPSFVYQHHLLPVSSGLYETLLREYFECVG
jgi:hypothetical protein